MSENTPKGKLAELMYPAMKKRHMSVQALASAVGVQRQTCYAWLHEHQRPSLEMLRRLSRVLDIPFVDLVIATHTDVEGVRLESLVQIYLGLSEERRRLLEKVASDIETDRFESFVQVYLDLPEESRRLLERLLENVAIAFKKESPPPSSS